MKDIVFVYYLFKREGEFFCWWLVSASGSTYLILTQIFGFLETDPVQIISTDN